MVKNLPAIQETWFQHQDREDPLHKDTSTHSSALAWRIPWTEEPGGYSPRGCKESDTTERLTLLLLDAAQTKQPEIVLGAWSEMCPAVFTFQRTTIFMHTGLKFAQSCLTLCDPMDCNLLGAFVHGILQQEYWSGLPFTTPGDLPNPEIEPRSPTLQAASLPSEPPWKFTRCVTYAIVCFMASMGRMQTQHLFTYKKNANIFIVIFVRNLNWRSDRKPHNFTRPNSGLGPWRSVFSAL